jgi:hypothetical protein
MSRSVAGAVACALFSLLAQATPQQSAPQPVLHDVQKLGQQVGSRVPDFTLLDQKGQSRTLASLIGPKGLMLVLTSFATDSTVAPGTQFSLVLDLRPARGVHVYATGVTGYKPIALSVQPQPGLLTRDALSPPSEDYHFKPLNEHVQVYQQPFRIVQDVLIDASPPRGGGRRGNLSSASGDASLTPSPSLRRPAHRERPTSRARRLCGSRVARRTQIP